MTTQAEALTAALTALYSEMCGDMARLNGELEAERHRYALLRDTLPRIQQASAEADARAKRYHEAMTALQARCNALAADVARLMKRTIAEDFEALKIVAVAHGVGI